MEHFKAALIAYLLFTLAGCSRQPVPQLHQAASLPVRVVALHTTFEQDLLSLGLVPIAGKRGVDLAQELTPAQFAGVEELSEPPNPEQLAKLHPDLILSTPITPSLRACLRS